jgi:hypothetical protein
MGGVLFNSKVLDKFLHFLLDFSTLSDPIDSLPEDGTTTCYNLCQQLLNSGMFFECEYVRSRLCLTWCESLKDKMTRLTLNHQDMGGDQNVSMFLEACVPAPNDPHISEAINLSYTQLCSMQHHIQVLSAYPLGENHRYFSKADSERLYMLLRQLNGLLIQTASHLTEENEFNLKMAQTLLSLFYHIQKLQASFNRDMKITNTVGVYIFLISD